MFLSISIFQYQYYLFTRFHLGTEFGVRIVSYRNGATQDEIIAKVKTMATNQATKKDIEGLATKAEIDAKVEKNK